MDFQHLWSNIVEISRGFDVTLTIFIWTLVFSIPLGLLLAILSQSKSAVVRKCVGVYTWVLRGTPLMLQVFFIYFGIPIMTGYQVRFDNYTAGLIGFILNYTAYFAEIFRGGIQSIERGQYEASSALGFGGGQRDDNSCQGYGAPCDNIAKGHFAVRERYRVERGQPDPVPDSRRVLSGDDVYPDSGNEVYGEEVYHKELISVSGRIPERPYIISA